MTQNIHEKKLLEKFGWNHSQTLFFYTKRELKSRKEGCQNIQKKIMAKLI